MTSEVRRAVPWRRAGNRGESCFSVNERYHANTLTIAAVVYLQADVVRGVMASVGAKAPESSHALHDLTSRGSTPRLPGATLAMTNRDDTVHDTPRLRSL